MPPSPPPSLDPDQQSVEQRAALLLRDPLDLRVAEARVQGLAVAQRLRPRLVGARTHAHLEPHLGVVAAPFGPSAFTGDTEKMEDVPATTKPHSSWLWSSVRRRAPTVVPWYAMCHFFSALEASQWGLILQRGHVAYRDVDMTAPLYMLGIERTDNWNHVASDRSRQQNNNNQTLLTVNHVRLLHVALTTGLTALSTHSWHAVRYYSNLPSQAERFRQHAVEGKLRRSGE
ncbi:hypothetical protein EYF80_021903 [Liparis tanakae]|uniref:Uncharacterized protein n=1 Tax=Liparis tanakae TaxID=230148 RepID=A0A4Z2HSF8_9TELE|nr:hypothetical protein EYF80_021903 [Liparis tanakae]